MTAYKHACHLFAEHAMFGIPGQVVHDPAPARPFQKQLQPWVRWKADGFWSGSRDQSEFRRAWRNREHAPALLVFLGPDRVMLDPDSPEAGELVTAKGVPPCKRIESARGVKYVLRSFDGAANVDQLGDVELELKTNLAVWAPSCNGEVVYRYVDGYSCCDVPSDPEAPGWDSVTLPRFIAAGGDLDYVRQLEHFQLTPGHMAEVEPELAEDFVRLFIDNLSDFMPENTNQWSTDVRTSLLQLQNMARRLEMSVVPVKHAKKHSPDWELTLDDIMDSQAFTAAPRQVLGVEGPIERGSIRQVRALAGNLPGARAAEGDELRFRVEDVSIRTGSGELGPVSRAIWMNDPFGLDLPTEQELLQERAVGDGLEAWAAG